MGETANIGSAIKRRVGFRHMAKIRSALNKLTRGRVGLYSTAEHYSGGPAAKVLLLLIVGYPTFAETEEAAKRGNEEARQELRLIKDALR